MTEIETPATVRVVPGELVATGEDGLFEVRHTLGTEDVKVLPYDADGAYVPPRMVTPIDECSAEFIVDRPVVRVDVTPSDQG